MNKKFLGYFLFISILLSNNIYSQINTDRPDQTESSLVLGKHSGKHAFNEKLKELGYDLGDNALMEVFGRFKDLADKKKEIFDEDLIALVGDQNQKLNEFIKFV